MEYVRAGLSFPSFLPAAGVTSVCVSPTHRRHGLLRALMRRQLADTARRGEALAVLAETCELSPDVRLGQLLAHLGFLGEDQTGRSLWDIDDAEMLQVLERHRDDLRRRA